MGKKRQRWEVGDLFCVPTMDAKQALGQVIGQEPDVLNSVAVALFDQQYVAVADVPIGSPPAPDRVYSVLFTTPDLLDSGAWTVVGKAHVQLGRGVYPYEHLRGNGFVGAKVIGSGIVTKFVNAFYGLTPWDDWYDPSYLDQLLISPEKRPSNRLILKGQ